MESIGIEQNKNVKVLSLCSFLVSGLVVGQEKDVSLFLDRTGEPATQQQVSSRLKNKDTSFSQPTTHPMFIQLLSKVCQLTK